MNRPTGNPRPDGADGTGTCNLFRQQFSVDFGYPVAFTQRLFAPANALLLDTVTRQEPARRHKLVFFIDDGVLQGHPALTAQIDGYLAAYRDRLERVGDWIAVTGGEPCKNLTLAGELQSELLALALDRQSFVIAIGGGAVLDLVGYVAATVHRGIRLIRVPSTVLAQNDAGIGVKNGVNAGGIKNAIGAFSPPFAVLNDLDLLRSLGDRDKRAGYAEAVKVSLIRDPAFFAWLEARAAPLAAFESDAMSYLIRRCAELHLQHIATSGDPFELGSARPLDFGHWGAHKLESLSRYQLRHGEAVALGMALDVRYAVEIGFLSDADAGRVIALLEALGFALWHPALDQRNPDTGRLLVLDGLDEFREHLGGDLTVPMLRTIGSCCDVHDIDESKVVAARGWLRDHNTSTAA